MSNFIAPTSYHLRNIARMKLIFLLEKLRVKLSKKFKHLGSLIP
ncbi:hypothetical protein NEOC65_001732 [Neochlamydia sp. AcF65]|nr:hypothetical protein [Neochlamydia sp. AcF65]MBS4171330.1 hypothetical protein [Neochlamydia sp. AcF95]